MRQTEQLAIGAQPKRLSSIFEATAYRQKQENWEHANKRHAPVRLLLAMTDLCTHTAFFTSNFASTLTGFLRSHEILRIASAVNV
ncbi:hypothetical protein DTL42_24275 [Bremerella cremea]|uniref:Uncharacterized protein n=1 Tax=Bremerella cremea TaxID=1031537 RepID=A0A368KIX0_9BACT|nr:hypothetical protein DTL42_24275 [Bremerella cremea]